MNIYNDNKNVTADFDKKEYEDNNKIASSQGEVADEFILSPREILELCLRESFYGDHREEIYSLCMNNFPECGQKIERVDRVPEIRNMLINYCTAKGIVDQLWSVVKRIRPIWYNEFHPQWEKSIKKEEEEKYAQYRGDEEKEIIDKQLEWKGENVVEWFFEDLDDAKKSMVMTVALFQGVEKGTFHSLVAHVQGILFPVIAHEQLAEKYSLDEEGEHCEEEKKTREIHLYQQLEDEQEQFKAAKIKVVPSYRYREFGKTEIDVVIFETKEYRKEVLKMLRYNISRKKQEIFSLVYDLGTDKSGEKRSCAVSAVRALSETDNFNELVEEIIKKWANDTNTFAQKTTAESLSAILREERHEQEIFKLLNSWMNKNNKRLVITRLLVYFFIADKFPQESMKAIESAVYSDESHLPVKISEIAMKVCRSNKKIFVDYICKWIEGDLVVLRQLAGTWFLRSIQLNDVAKEQELREKTAEIIFHLWREIDYDETASKLKEWAEEALAAEEDDFENSRSLFRLLYKRCEKELSHYLPKWQKQREEDRARAAKRYGADAVLQTESERRFLELKPVN
uniref:hypothetical protein n=1 Tax=Candidatus Electronema sp. TaxID=2698783 RepID=UPI00405732EC